MKVTGLSPSAAFSASSASSTVPPTTSGVNSAVTVRSNETGECNNATPPAAGYARLVHVR